MSQVVVAGDSIGISDRRLTTIEVALSLANVIRMLDTKLVSIFIRGSYSDDEPVKTKRIVVVSGIDLEATIAQTVPDEEVVSAVRRALDVSEPERIGKRGWHLPYVTQAEHRLAPVSLLQRAAAVRCYRGTKIGGALHVDLDAYREALRVSNGRVLEHIATPVAERGWKPSHLSGWNILEAVTPSIAATF